MSPLLSPRSALVLLAAVLAGFLVGCVFFVAYGGNTAGAVLAGLGGTASAVILFNRIIGTRDPHDGSS